MYRGYKVNPIIPAGRKSLMSILFNYFEIHSDVIDEVMICENTMIDADIKWFREVEEGNAMYKTYRVPPRHKFIEKPVQYNTGRFYEYTVDPDTIYIRFDDDILYIDDNYFKNIFDACIDHPEYFLVFGNIWNNATTSYIHQKQNKINNEICTVQSPYCMDMCGWG